VLLLSSKKLAARAGLAVKALNEASGGETSHSVPDQVVPVPQSSEQSAWQVVPERSVPVPHEMLDWQTPPTAWVSEPQMVSGRHCPAERYVPSPQDSSEESGKQEPLEA
jgi:hypothetical protein